jgi:hypothetical protein
MSSVKAYKVLACLGVAVLLLASVAGLAVADTTIPGTNITIPDVLPDVNLPVDVPGTVEQVTDAILPDAQVPDLPVPDLPTPNPAAVIQTVTGAPAAVAATIDSIPVPDVRGQVPSLPAGLPSVTEVVGQVKSVIDQTPVGDLINALIGSTPLPQTGLILSNIIRMIPQQILDLPLVKPLLALLQSLLDTLLKPPVAATVTPGSKTASTPAALAAVLATNPPLAPALSATSDPVAGNTFDHLPYTGADFTIAAFALLGLAVCLFLVRRFELSMKGRS